jgi:diguanylate cyclase (GGDEF)-like protein
MVVLLPDTDLDSALVVAERVRAQIEELSVPVTQAKGGDPVFLSVTVSIGVASVPTHGPDLESALQLADDALYVAKNGGRNQVSVAPGAPPDQPARQAG